MFITICTRLLFSSCKLCSSFWLMAAPLVHAPTDKNLIYCLHIHIHIKWLAHIYAIFSNIRLKYFYAFHATYLLYILSLFVLSLSLARSLHSCASDAAVAAAAVPSQHHHREQRGRHPSFVCFGEMLSTPEFVEVSNGKKTARL